MPAPTYLRGVQVDEATLDADLPERRSGARETVARVQQARRALQMVPRLRPFGAGVRLWSPAAAAPAPTATWLALDLGRRMSRVQAELDRMTHVDLRCVDVDHEVRVTVSPIADAVISPPILLAVEADLKKAIDPALYLVYEQRRDANKLRVRP